MITTTMTKVSNQQTTDPIFDSATVRQEHYSKFVFDRTKGRYAGHPKRGRSPAVRQSRQAAVAGEVAAAAAAAAEGRSWHTGPQTSQL